MKDHSSDLVSLLDDPQRQQPRRNIIVNGILPNEFNSPNQSKRVFGESVKRSEEKLRFRQILRNDVEHDPQFLGSGVACADKRDDQTVTTKHFSFVDKDIAECNSVVAQDESDEDDELLCSIDIEELEAKHLATKSNHRKDNDSVAAAQSDIERQFSFLCNISLTLLQN